MALTNDNMEGATTMMNGNNGDCISDLLIFALLIGGGGLFGNRGECNDWARNEHQHMDTREEIRFNEASTQAQMNAIASNDWQKSILMEICDTDKIIMNGTAANLAATADAKFDNAILLKDMALDNFKCCCETQKAIAASETAILSRLDAFENQNLRDKVQELQLGYSQLQQNQTLVQAIRPCPVPSYKTCNPWSGAAYNGGCGTGCF